MPSILVFGGFRLRNVLSILHVRPYSLPQDHFPASDCLYLIARSFSNVREIAREAQRAFGALVGFRPWRCLFPFFVSKFRGPKLTFVPVEEIVVDEQCEI
jgi:hypothetical protein